MDTTAPATARERLVETLSKEQSTRGMDDEQFARFLLVSRPTWIMTRSGQMAVGIKLLSGVAYRFRDLKGEVDACLEEIGRERQAALEQPSPSGTIN